MNKKDIIEAKKLKDAQDDLNKLDDILNDVSKFRIQSNKIYYEITHKTEYISYIVFARAKNKLKYGDFQFEEISNYMMRRKIIKMLRQAVSAYMDVELLGKAINEQE